MASLTRSAPAGAGLAGLISRVHGVFSAIPHSAIALLARFAIAGVFWKSGQTKIQGFQFDPIAGVYEFGLPRFADSTLFLFQEEYKVPLLPPELSAVMATVGEHVFPVLILIGLATRFSALALLGMTAVIQIFVYPSAYATHATWAAILLFLMWRGPGALSIDHVLARGRG